MDKRKEKIKYRSWHRGTREADLFLGKFIDKYINDLNEILLTNFEDFINNYSDQEIISFDYDEHVNADDTKSVWWKILVKKKV